MEINPDEYPWKPVYKLLTGAVVPRPIAWVSTINPEGGANLAPFSFFNVVCAMPPHLMFNPQVRETDSGTKDTLRNVRLTEEFVVNIVTEDLAQAMNETSAELPGEVDEFTVAGLAPCPSTLVRPPGIAASPVRLECKLAHLIDISDQPGGGSVVIGRIVYMHIADDILEAADKIDVRKLKPIGRLGGPSYCRVQDVFQMIRPPSQIQAGHQNPLNHQSSKGTIR